MKTPEQQKRDEDWSVLNGQVVGSESLPPATGSESPPPAAQLEWLWANCKIVYWPKDDRYPIEHNPHARKYSRDAIEAEMPNNDLIDPSVK